MGYISQAEIIGMMIGFAVFFSFFLFPTIYLFSFANGAREAAFNNDQEGLKKALRRLKRFFVVWGIVVIVLAAIYLLAFLFGEVSFSI